MPMRTTWSSSPGGGSIPTSRHCSARPLVGRLARYVAVSDRQLFPVECAHEDERRVPQVREPVGVHGLRPLHAQLIQQLETQGPAAEVALCQHGVGGVVEDGVRLGGASLSQAAPAGRVPLEVCGVQPGRGCVKCDQLEQGLQVVGRGVASEALEKLIYIGGHRDSLARQQLVQRHAVVQAGAAAVNQRGCVLSGHVVRVVNQRVASRAVGAEYYLVIAEVGLLSDYGDAVGQCPP